jgi:hypothetical protein
MKNKVSKRGLAALLPILIAAACYCAWLIVSGACGRNAESYTLTQIRLPASIGSALPPERTLITDQEYGKVISYLDFLDSLKASEKTRPVYDSIVRASPGLLDSLMLTHRMYLLQP